MTENPTVPSPPGLPQLPSNATSTSTPDETGDSGGEIQCVCDCTEDDGYTICCDKCETWQHIACMQLHEDDLPSKYLCPICLPRPIDVRRARELQKQRRRDEKNNRRKRSGTTSHKKKETQLSGQNGVKTAQGTEKSGSTAKLLSPREPQAPTARKRNQRTLHSLQNATGNTNSGASANAVGSGSGSPVDLPDRNGDAESDNDLDKYRYEYVDITNGKNKYASDEVKDYLSRSTMTKHGEYFKRYTPQEFAAILFPKASVRILPDLSKLYSEHTRWCFVLESACSRGKPVALFKGEVKFQESYKQEPINQYSLWHHPKPYVVFHPDLPIVIDARQSGSEARFVRRSCRPNLRVNTIVVDDSNVHFALSAIEPIKVGTELTLGWDWNGSKQPQHLAEERFDFSKLNSDEMRQAALWVENLLDKMGDCACAGGSDCLLAKIKKCGGIGSVAGKRPATNGNGRKQRIKRNASAESNTSKEQTPDIASTQANDDEDSFGSSMKVKSRSRDLTPSQAHDTAVESDTMTVREQRKLKVALSRIEMQQTQEQVQPNKRRKGNNNASLVAARSVSPGPESARGADIQKPHKCDSPEISPGGRSNGREISVVDAGAGRSPSVGFHDRDHGGASKSPVASSASSKIRRKVKTKGPKSNYIDSSMQTEPDDELPWWKLPVQKTPPRPPRLPLRKRLMQSLLRDREEAASAAISAQDGKRKHDCFAEDTTVPLQSSKVPKTGEPEGVREIPEAPPGMATLPTGSSQTLASVSDTPADHPDPNVVKGLPLPRPPDGGGPGLGNLFANSDLSHRAMSQTKAGQVPGGADQMNGVQSTRLHLQLPSPSNLPSGPPSSSTGYGISPLSSTTNTAFSPSVMVSLGAPGIGASPSPTKTKKLSLQDYRKRSHKSADVAPEKKEEEAAALKILDAGPDQQLAFLNVLPPGDALPTPAPTTSVDTKIIPASAWGVR